VTSPAPGEAPARPLADPSVRALAVVRLRTGLGDLLASVPALRAVRRARPDLHVTLISFAEVEDVVRRQSDYVDEFLPFPGHPHIPERPAPSDEVWQAFLTDARARRFDLAVQMYGALAGANLVTEQIGARITGGFLTPGAYAGSLATHLPYPYRAHEVNRHLRLVGFLGVPPDGRYLEFPLTEDERNQAAAVLGGLSGYAVVHPGATAASRRWPPERFARVADGLAERGIPVVLTGVAGETDLVAAVAAGMRAPARQLAGRTSLGTAAAIVDGARLVISSDTGIVQVAVARHTPTVTVYLAGDAARWRGEDRDRHRAALVDVGCNPCGLQRCPIDFRCATWLSPEAVLAECDRVLAGQPATEGVRRSS
jgi:ADP-heptose:LPS heptosyltransferase